MEKRQRNSRDSDRNYVDNDILTTTTTSKCRVSMAGKKESAFIHLAGGAAGGTVGTAITCPLEVVKTRLQSSHGHEIRRQVQLERLQAKQRLSSSAASTSSGVFQRMPRPSHSIIFHCFKSVWQEGGFRALYKGLGPNLIGVAPSKAIYFGFYSTFKHFFNEKFPPNSHSVHMLSAAGAAFITATAVNPVWVVKTRLQLNPSRIGAWQCCRNIFQREGLLGFYRGVTGSYFGIAETILQFVLYEYFRGWIQNPEENPFGKFMLAGAIAKLIAGCALYPHEVIRTRLREEGSKKGFREIVWHISRVEGWRTFYRGLSVQLIRAVPNTAITMAVYEAVVYGLPRVWNWWSEAAEIEERID